LRKPNTLSHSKGSVKVERILGIIAIGTIVAAWIVGSVRVKADVLPSLKMAVPGAERFESLGRMTYAAWGNRSSEVLLGYVKIASGMGYGGPTSVAVATDTKGEVIGLAIVDYKDTPSYFNRVLNSDFISSLRGKAYDDEFVLGKDVDAVSGATRSSGAIVESVRLGSRDIAHRHLGLDLVAEKEARIQFGVPEIVLIALYALGLIGRLKSFKFKKLVRWGSLLIGLLVLGFIYDNPLTISMVNQVLLGYWPQWQTNLYWYLLNGGIVLFFTVDKKNPYCNWFCPFGAAQECLGALGKAKTRSPGRYRGLLKWLHRTLAWAAIIIALLFRNPGLSSYEVFGTFFELVGSNYQFVLLGIVVVTSLYILRPWCTYICPIRPVDDYVRTMRRWMRESWQKRMTSKAA